MENRCKYCGSTELSYYKGTHVGEYCNNCGKWQRWVGVKELKAKRIDIENLPYIDMRTGSMKVMGREEHLKAHSVGIQDDKGTTRLVHGVTACCGYNFGGNIEGVRFCPICGKYIV